MNSVIQTMVEQPTSPMIDPLSSQHAHALVRVIETASEVRRRYQFFVWSQSYLKTLVPHQLVVCGAYLRTSKTLGFEAFNSVPVPSPMLATVTDGSSALMQQMVGAWIDGRGRSVVVDLRSMKGVIAGAERDRLLDAGFSEVLVHGVARPQRPAELESLFLLASQNFRCSEQQRMYLELLLPHLHTAWLRVQATEREMSGAPTVAPPTRSEAGKALITDREAQILYWVREGKSNQQIGDELGISVLTVKNHVQKILRKLGAANRAQAVAKAMTLNLLAHSAPGAAEGGQRANGAAHGE
jgi:transcriptional regulator EpsA